jgi:pSer/pThr/pTyr-binding forkhead associated (FHA) protein
MSLNSKKTLTLNNYFFTVLQQAFLVFYKIALDRSFSLPDLHTRSSGKRGGVSLKHAILFRMSNRTVQVVFYDRSEVLLSSEARVITYVNKQLVRTEHSLDDILTSSRLDIAKRLKYTKDIMYRLIHTQTK